MSETVELQPGTLERLSEIDEWLKKFTKNPIRVMMGQRPRVIEVGRYNVAGQDTIFDGDAKPIGGGATLRFIFDEPREATLFKLTWR